MTEQLSINLALDISYIYGIVNGEEASFSLTSPGVWSAIVPKTPDGKYVVSITAYNNLGSATQYNTVIYKLDDIIALKTDWTSNDYYNADDLNRVEANTQFIAELLEEMQYAIPLGEIRTDRDMTSIDFVSSINRVERNIDAIRENMLTPPSYQAMKVWPQKTGFSYLDANRFEMNLKLLYEWALLIKDNFIYCGTFNCGEEVI